MTHGAALRSAIGAARYRLTGHRMPLAAWIAVTRRCNALCHYCALPLSKSVELDTAQLVALVDALAAKGTTRVTLTGGEPLLREDLGIVVDRCASHEMFTVIQTNGVLYPERADELRRAARLSIALDGDERAHDANREPGAWVSAVRAVRAAVSRGVDVHTLTTITRHNVDDLDVVLDMAEREGFVAEFEVLQHEPVVAEPLAADLAPEPARLRRALLRLLDARLAGRPVAMSEKFLRYLLLWDRYDRPISSEPHEDLHCLAGQLFVAVDTDGTMLPCPLWSRRFPGKNVVRDGLDAAFESVRDNPCRACTSTALSEYNYVYNLNAPSVYERVRAVIAHGPPGRGWAA